MQVTLVGKITSCDELSTQLKLRLDDGTGTAEVCHWIDSDSEPHQVSFVSRQTLMAMLDANALYQAAIAEPGQYKLSNVTGTCLTGTKACGNPDQFLFWDGIHPTTAAHRILAQRAFDAVREQLNVGV